MHRLVSPRPLVIVVLVTLAGCGDQPQPKPPTPPSATAPTPKPAPNTTSVPNAVGEKPPALAPGSDPTAPATPTPAPPVRASKVSGQDDDATKLEAAGIIAPKPTSWTWQQPTQQMRTLQYAVPGKGSSTGAAELVVSVFSEGMRGGPIETNVQRWKNQFRDKDGNPPTPIESDRTIDGVPVHLIDLEGTYQGMGGAAAPNTLQFGAIIDAPGGRVFLRLNGPKDTVEAARADWNALIDGIRKSNG